MVEAKINNYKKALVEVDAVLSCLDYNEYKKIPTNIIDAIENNKPVVLKNITKGEEYQLDSSHLSSRQRAMLVCGGLLDYTREINK